MAAESLLAERQARRDLSHTMPAGRHRGNNQAYHIVHKLIVGWTTWKMRMGFMGKPLVADVVVFFLHWTDILLQFLAAKVYLVGNYVVVKIIQSVAKKYQDLKKAFFTRIL